MMKMMWVLLLFDGGLDQGCWLIKTRKYEKRGEKTNKNYLINEKEKKKKRKTRGWLRRERGI